MDQPHRRLHHDHQEQHQYHVTNQHQEPQPRHYQQRRSWRSSQQRRNSCHRLAPFTPTIPFFVMMLMILLLMFSSLPTYKAQQAPTLSDLVPFEYHDEVNISTNNTNTSNSTTTSTFTRSYRTNVCDRQRMLLDGNIELRDALEGLNISIAMTNYYGVPNEEKFFSLNDQGTIKDVDPGLFVVIMDEIARRGKFQWRDSFAAISPPPSGVSWTQLLEWETYHYDIACDYWARSVERMSRGISFPHGWYDGSIVMVTRTPQIIEKFNFWSFMIPFTYDVWFAIGFAIFLTGFGYFFIQRLTDSKADDRYLEDKPLTTIFLAALTFTGHLEFQPTTISGRLLSLSWGFWALIMVSAYTANMASFLVVQSSTNIISRISTIEAALLTSTPLCVQRGSVMDDILSEKYPDLKLVRKDTEQDMFEGLRLGWYGGKGGCGALLTNLGTYDIYQSRITTNEDCSLGTDRRVLLNLPAGFSTAVDTAIYCTSLISYVLDLHLQEMRRDGFIDMAWSHHVSKVSSIQCPRDGGGGSSTTGTNNNDGNEDDGSGGMALKDMGGIFLTHFMMSTIALMFALYQYFHAKQYKPEKKLRPLKLDVLPVENMKSTMNASVDIVKNTASTSQRLITQSSQRLVKVTSSAASKTLPQMRSIPSFRWSSTRNVPVSGANNTSSNNSNDRNGTICGSDDEDGEVGAPMRSTHPVEAGPEK